MNKNKHGGSSSQNKNKKRKILLGTLIPGSIFVGAACGLGIYYGCYKPKTFVFKNNSEVNSYLNNHRVIHNETFDWSNSTTNSSMLSWLWKRSNFGLQNMINSFLLQKEPIWILDISSEITLTTKYHWFKIHLTYQFLGTEAYQTWTIKNFTNKGYTLLFNSYVGSTYDNSITRISSWKACYLQPNITETRIDTSSSSSSGSNDIQIAGPLPYEYPNIIWP